MTDERRGDERRTADRSAAEDAFLVAIDTRLAGFATSIKGAVAAVRVARAVAWLAIAAAALSIILAIGGWVLADEVRDSSRERKEALCGLAFLFDESIRISGHPPEGPLAEAYERWKTDIDVLKCPQYQEAN